MTTMNWRNALVTLGAGAVFLAAGAGTALGQNNRNTPPAPNKNTVVDPTKPLVERMLPRGKTKDWVMMVDLYYPGQMVNAPPVNRWGEIRPDYNYPGRTITQQEWNRLVGTSQQGVKFDTAAIVFPVPLSSAGHIASEATFESEIKVNSRVFPSEPKFSNTYQSGERLARWDMRDIDAGKIQLHIEIPVTCWETYFNEAEAAKVEWPKGDWPTEAKTALEPVYLVEYANQESEIAETKKMLDELRDRWLKGRDPRSIKPVQLAKELAGHVLERVDPSAGDSVYGTMPGTFIGLLSMTVSEVLTNKRCYNLDPAPFLAAVYRNAGLPARVVYGFDMSEEKDKDGELNGKGRSKLHAWTEFAVLDDKTGAVVWVPVDVIKMRKSSSRMQRLDRPWKFFAANEDLTYTIPISFHLHPPTGVTVRSLPAFWGWLCTPETPPLPHSLKIDAMGQNSRDKQRNEEERNKNKNKKP
jgi:hypothetical protein